MNMINGGIKVGSISCFGAGRLEFKTAYKYTLRPEYAKHFIRTKKINQLVGRKKSSHSPLMRSLQRVQQ